MKVHRKCGTCLPYLYDDLWLCILNQLPCVHDRLQFRLVSHFFCSDTKNTNNAKDVKDSKNTKNVKNAKSLSVYNIVAESIRCGISERLNTQFVGNIPLKDLIRIFEYSKGIILHPYRQFGRSRHSEIFFRDSILIGRHFEIQRLHLYHKISRISRKHLHIRSATTEELIAGYFAVCRVLGQHGVVHIRNIADKSTHVEYSQFDTFSILPGDFIAVDYMCDIFYAVGCA